MHASQGTSDRQDHERFQRAGQERDTSGQLPIMESRWRGSLIHGEQLAWVTAQGARTAVSSAVITNVFQTNYKRDNEFLHWLFKYPICTGKLEACAYVLVNFTPASHYQSRRGSNFL